MSFKQMKNILFLLLLSYMNPKFINLNIESLDDLDNIIKRETETKKAKKKLSESVGTNKDECLASESETIQIFKEKYNIDLKDKTITRNLRFIAGNCNPVILIPGVLSVALRTKIDCENLYNKERDVYKKLKFFCQLDDVCSNTTSNYDENLFLKIMEEFGFLRPYACELLGYCRNLYGACFAYIMNIFDKDECAELDSNKNVCTVSDYVKVLFFGGTKGSFEESKCGLKAISNILPELPLPNTKIYGDIIDLLENLGYNSGFSLGGIPNDFRRFISTNQFSKKTFRYLIEYFYENTGKPVVIIAHSFGNLVALNYLVSKENQDLLPKIKKFIALGAPFAGATGLLNTYLHGLDDFNTAFTEFHYLGQSLLFKSMPVLSELRPMPAFSKLKEKEEYSQFVKIIKDRIDLENCIFKGNCNDSTILKRNKEFDELFGSYLPSLSSDACKEGKNPQKQFEKKCFLNFYNIFEQPLVIQVNNINEIDQNNFDKIEYCNKNPSKCFYAKEIGGEKRSVDELFSMGNYTYNLSQMHEFFEIYNKNKEIYGLNEDITYSDFETEEEFRKENLLQIEHQKNISLINDLPIPPVDTDIVYSSIASTDTGSFLGNDFVKNGKTIYSGGDGTVSTWSSVLVGLKWIYDKKRNNLTQKIRLVEYCSKLSANFPYNEDNNFISLGCECLKKDKYNDLDNCNHQYMLFDSNIFSYIKNV